MIMFFLFILCFHLLAGRFLIPGLPLEPLQHVVRDQVEFQVLHTQRTAVPIAQHFELERIAEVDQFQAAGAVFVALLFQRHGDHILAGGMLISPMFANRLLQVDLLQLLVESGEVQLNQILQLLWTERLGAFLTDLRQKPAQFLAREVAFDCMTQPNFVLVVLTTCFFAQRLGFPAVRVLAFLQLFAQIRLLFLEIQTLI